MKSKGYRSGIYLLPNLLTTASLFSAFYSIVSSMQGQLEHAVIAIFVGMIADGLDGRIARMTNTQTAFGAEYDSLSDMVTFGVAPSLLLFNWNLHLLGKFGWLVSFLYTAAVALRLARFNTQLATSDKSYFQGISCPPSAALVASFAWFCYQNEWNNTYVAVVTAVIVISMAVLMVSNVRYHSFKNVDFKGRVPFLYVLIVVIVFAAVASYPSLVLFVCSSIYALSGPLQTLLAIQRARKKRSMAATIRKRRSK